MKFFKKNIHRENIMTHTNRSKLFAIFLCEAYVQVIRGAEELITNKHQKWFGETL